MDKDHFGELRSILQRGASQDTWDALSAYLVAHVERWDTSEHEALLSYCTGHVRQWPEKLPTFAPKGWFSGPLKQVAAHPLTPFFIFCFQDRTTALREALGEVLSSHKAKAFPKHVDPDALGELRWRHNGEALGDAELRRFVMMLREHCKRPSYSAQLAQMRQLLTDEDTHRWSAKLLDMTWDKQDSAHAWGVHQLAYLGSRHHIKRLAEAVLAKHSEGYLMQRAVALLALVGDRDALTFMSHLAHEEHDAPRRAEARRHLHAIAQAHRSTKYRAFLCMHTDHDTELRDVLAQCRVTDEKRLSDFAEPLEHAMCTSAMFLGRHVNQHGSESQVGALGWIIFAKHDGVTFRITSEGARDLSGEPVKLHPDELLTIAHPVMLEARGELATWWTSFAEEGLDEASVQFERDIYPTSSRLLPEGGILVTHPARFAQCGIDYNRVRIRQRRAPHVPGGSEQYVVAYYEPPGHTWRIELHVTRHAEHLHIDKAQILPTIYKYDPVRIDPVIHSEACRLMKQFERILTKV